MWSENGPCYIIGEAGSNHDGKLDQALELIEVAADARCDAVKFQCIPPFQRDWWEDLDERADNLGLDLLATHFDVEAVRFLQEMGVPLLKIASPEIINEALLNEAAGTGLPVILSTGMASIGDIDAALSRRGRHWFEVALLQCTTRYPAPPEQANLRAMDTMRQAFGFPVGLSDHSLGTAIPIAAVALGAAVVEKHFTLDRTLEGPDHHYALEPVELKAMVEGIRQVEQALGDGRKDGPQEGEMVEARGRQLTW